MSIFAVLFCQPMSFPAVECTAQSRSSSCHVTIPAAVFSTRCHFSCEVLILVFVLFLIDTGILNRTRVLERRTFHITLLWWHLKSYFPSIVCWIHSPLAMEFQFFSVFLALTIFCHNTTKVYEFWWSIIDMLMHYRRKISQQSHCQLGVFCHVELDSVESSW